MKASELAKELGTTRLDAYNSLSRLQEMGIVTVTADRPMRFSSMNVHQAIEHIIGMRKQQLNRLVEGYDEISKDVTKESKPSKLLQGTLMTLASLYSKREAIFTAV